MLSRMAIAFLPRSKHLLISWLQSLFTMILEPKKIKSLTVFIVFPSICHSDLRGRGSSSSGKTVMGLILRARLDEAEAQRTE